MSLRTYLGVASGKESACQCRMYKRNRLNPWVWKIPWNRKWQPTPVFLPGKFHGQRSLAGYHYLGPQIDTTEYVCMCVDVHAHTHADTHLICCLILSYNTQWSVVLHFVYLLFFQGYICRWKIWIKFETIF